MVTKRRSYKGSRVDDLYNEMSLGQRYDVDVYGGWKPGQPRPEDRYIGNSLVPNPYDEWKKKKDKETFRYMPASNDRYTKEVADLCVKVMDGLKQVQRELPDFLSMARQAIDSDDRDFLNDALVEGKYMYETVWGLVGLPATNLEQKVEGWGQGDPRPFQVHGDRGREMKPGTYFEKHLHSLRWFHNRFDIPYFQKWEFTNDGIGEKQYDQIRQYFAGLFRVDLNRKAKELIAELTAFTDHYLKGFGKSASEEDYESIMSDNRDVIEEAAIQAVRRLFAKRQGR